MHRLVILVQQNDFKHYPSIAQPGKSLGLSDLSLEMNRVANINGCGELPFKTAEHIHCAYQETHLESQSAGKAQSEQAMRNSLPCTGFRRIDLAGMYLVVIA